MKLHLSEIVFMRVSGILPKHQTSGGNYVRYKPSSYMWEPYGTASGGYWF